MVISIRHEKSTWKEDNEGKEYGVCMKKLKHVADKYQKSRNGLATKASSTPIECKLE
jgi:hypothetical protein